MSTELQRVKEALDLAIGELSKKARHTYPDGVTCEEACHRVLLSIKSVLHPPPEMEEVPVVKWLCPLCDKVWPGETVMVSCCKTPLVKLTGTYLRAKTVPVERSVSASVEWREGTGSRFGLPIAYPVVKEDSGDAVYELIGKTGTLTFTWQE